MSDVYSYPLLIELEENNFPKIKIKLLKYFNSKKSGGGDCEVDYERDSRTAVLRFRTEQDQKNVLGKESHQIQLDTAVLKMTVRFPPDEKTAAAPAPAPQEVPSDNGNKTSEVQAEAKGRDDVAAEETLCSTSAVLGNVPEETSLELLEMLVENIIKGSKSPSASFTLEIIHGISSVVVTFESGKESTNFVARCPQNRMFTSKRLSVRPLEVTKQVAIEDTQKFDTDFLHLYFENAGEDVESVLLIEGEQFVVTFKDSQAVQKVMKKKHHIQQEEFRVYPFYPSLGAALYGKDRPCLKLPAAISEPTDDAVWRYLNEHKSALETIHSDLAKHFCSVKHKGSAVILRPVPSILGQKDAKAIIKEWKSTVGSAFAQAMSKFKSLKFQPDSEVLEECVENIGQMLQNKDVTLVHDKASGVLSVVGFVDEVNKLEQSLRKIRVKQEVPSDNVNETSEVQAEAKGRDDVAAEETLCSTSAVLGNVPEEMTLFILEMLVENIIKGSKSPSASFTLEIIHGISSVVVTFESGKESTDFVARCPQNKMFTSKGLSVRPLELTKQVAIEDTQKFYTDFLHLYFENAGEDVESVLLNEGEQFIVTFKDSQAVQKVVKKKHHIQQEEFRVYPFYPSLGAALYGKDRPCLNLPAAISEPTDDAVWRYLNEHKSALETIHRDLAKHFCSVKHEGSAVILRPVPSILGQKDAKAIIKEWKSTVGSAFAQAMSKFKSLKFQPDSEVLEECVENIGQMLQNKDVTLVHDKASGVLSVVGFVDEVNKLEQSLHKIRVKQEVPSDNVNKTSEVQAEAKGRDDVAAEETLCSTSAVLGNVPEETSLELLEMLVENIIKGSKSPSASFTLEIIHGISSVVVTFESGKESTDFVARCPQNRMFTSKGLSVRPLEVTKQVAIEDTQKFEKDYLHLYFENAGGDVESVLLIEGEQFIVTFKDSQAVQKVMKKKHHIQQEEFRVYPFYPSLGAALYGKDRPCLKLPAAISEPTDDAVWRYLNEHKSALETIHSDLAKHFCSVKHEGSAVILRPVPSILGQKDAKAIIKEWKSTVGSAFAQAMSKFKSLKFQPDSEVLGECVENIGQMLQNKDVTLVHDKASGVLSVVGFVDEVNKLEQSLHKIRVKQEVPSDNVNKTSEVQAEAKGRDDVAAEETLCSTSAVLGNVPEETSLELLEMLVENIIKGSKSPSASFTLEIIHGISSVVVTFESGKESTDFVARCPQNRMFTSKGLSVRPLEVTKQVAIEDTQKFEKDYLHLYFENAGGDVESVLLIEGEQFIVTFKDSQAVQKVMKKKHHIQQEEFRVYPFYPSLGAALYGKDRPCLKLPAAISEPTDDAVWRYLNEHKSALETIHSDLAKHFCSVKHEGSAVILRPVPSILGQKDAKAIIKEWKSTVGSAFAQAMSKFKSLKFQPDSEVLGECVENIGQMLQNKDVTLVHDKASGVLSVVGFVDEVNKLEQSLRKIRVKQEVPSDNVNETSEVQAETKGRDDVAAEEMVCSTSAVLGNVPEEMSQEVLEMLVENIIKGSKFPSASFTLEIIHGISSVVVTFKSGKESTDFVARCPQNRIFTSKGLSVRPLELTKQVAIEDTQKFNKGFLHLYFENAGGDVESVLLIEGEQFIVTFKDNQAAQKVVKEKHHSKQEEFRVYPFYPSLGAALYGKDRPCLKLPAAISEPTDDAMWRYLNDHKSALETIHRDLAKHFCSVKHEGSALILRPVPSILGQKDAKAIIKEWKSTVGSAFAQAMSKFKSLKFQPDSEVLEECVENIRQMLHNKDVTLVHDKASGVLSVVGFVDEVNKLEQSLRKIRVKQEVPSDNVNETSEVQAETKGRDDVAAEEMVCSTSAVLGNVPEEMSQEVLEMIVENIIKRSKSPSASFTLEIIHGISSVVVTFKSGKESTDFVARCPQNRIFTSKGLSVRPLELTKQVAIEDTQKFNKDFLHLYFENAGGDVESVLLIEGEQFIVTFKDNQAAQKVVKEKHHSKQEEFRVYPFYSSLGAALYGKDRPCLKLPAAISEPTDDAVWRYLNDHKSALETIHRDLAKHFCSVKHEGSALILRPVPSILGQKDAKAIIKEWKSTVGSAFAQAMSKFKSLKFQPDSEALEECVENIGQMLQNKDVTLVHDKASGVLSVVGFVDEVNKLEQSLRKTINKIEGRVQREKATKTDVIKQEELKRYMDIVSKVADWQYQQQGLQYQSFDQKTNFHLEQAMQQKLKDVKVNIQGQDFTVTLPNGPATNKKGDALQIRRIDKLKDAVPAHWDAMPHNTTCVAVPIHAGTPEHAEVLNLFNASCKQTVIKIERIQNPMLWKSIQIKKCDIEQRNGHANNERRLFHGTTKTTVNIINQNGFNRVYAGKNAAAFGNGTYFAVNANFSAQDTYSKPNLIGEKCMYLCQVLTGDYAVGKAGMIEPPVKHNKAPQLYDSVVDNMANPSMFIIFHDVQAYPEYLITFQ